MLWANWNGDELQNIFHNLTEISVLVGSVTVFCWIWLANNLINNAFLAITADGYIKQRRSGMYSWLKNDLVDPED